MRTWVALVLLLLLGVAVAGTPKPAVGRRIINLPGRTDTLPFSNAVLAGDTLYLSGTIGIDPATGRPPANIEEEARLVLDNLKRVLEAAGMGMEDLVSVTVYCPDLSL
ncbi:MAG: RidA family protein, partial [Firmicutes bacterium]|nr:RidA family protein [Bacillota bacterium]